jgi:protein-disulfide isomerase
VLTGPDVRQRMVATGEVRWIFRDFPIDGHPNSAVAHHAAQCAAEQGRFWEMHDQIFFNHGRWVTDRRADRVIGDLAEAIGLDMRQYDDCMDEGRYRARLQQGKEEAAANGVSVTPTFEINGTRYTGAFPYDDLRKLVDEALAEAR